MRLRQRAAGRHQTQIPKLNALYPPEMQMNIHISDSEGVHPLGVSASDPMEQPARALVSLLLHAGSSPLRLRALAVHPLTAHSGPSNRRI